MKHETMKQFNYETMKHETMKQFNYESVKQILNIKTICNSEFRIITHINVRNRVQLHFL